MVPLLQALLSDLDAATAAASGAAEEAPSERVERGPVGGEGS
jgi:hypothetical protein